MPNKRPEPPRKRKGGVVKATKKTAPSTRAFYIVAATIVVLGIAALSWASTRPKDTGVASRIDSTLPPVQSSGYVIGSPQARLEVTEFGDFECPQCGRFATLTEPDVRARLVNSGLIRYRFIDYPLPMHANTWNASRAAACADEQGKFWEMHDAIFQNQDRWNGEATSSPDKVLKSVGEQIPGINKAQLDQCIDTKKTQAKIQAHYQLAVARKVQATPTFYFGDKQVEGFLSYDDFKAMTDSALDALPANAPRDTTTKVDTKPGVALPIKKGE